MGAIFTKQHMLWLVIGIVFGKVVLPRILPSAS